MKMLTIGATVLLALAFAACDPPDAMPDDPAAATTAEASAEAEDLLAKYTSVTLNADLSVLSERERQMIPLLIEAGQAMEEIFWMQAYGNKDTLMASIDDPGLRRFAEINYGPWDRLDDNAPFIGGVGEKPKGANLYPADITEEELEAAAQANPELKSLYTMVRRDDDGALQAIPYHEYFEEQMQVAAAKLRQAATLADEGGLRRYLDLRADALLSGNYQPSDLAWMDMKDNTIDVVIGPIETYEDQLLGAKAAAETYVLIKDKAWSQRLTRYAELLPALQDDLPVPEDYKQETPGANSDLGSDLAWMDMKDNTIDVVIGPIETYEDQLLGAKAAAETYVLIKDKAWSQRLTRYAELLPALQDDLPVPEDYKQETPGANSDLGAYDAIYYAGDCNAGSKTIAINLPNDEEVQLQKGTRRLQLKNAMRAKFDKVLLPIAGMLIAEDQRQHITFDAFFGNTMFHEVAHGLGIKNTITGRGTVREALKNHASSLEEGKADVLGLYMVTTLSEQGEWDGDMMNHYVTFFTSIFRSVRFGLSSAHGRANLIRFNYFKEKDAFTRDEATGVYRIDFEMMQQATNALSEQILRLQGDGDYDAVDAFVGRYMAFGDQLQADLDRLGEQGIPRDIVFEQGLSVLGLESTSP